MTSIFAEVGGTRQIYLLKKVKMVILFLLTEFNFGHKTIVQWYLVGAQDSHVVL